MTAQVQVDAAMFAQLARTATVNGTLIAFVELAVDWAQKAETIALGLQDKVADMEAERDRLREGLKKIMELDDDMGIYPAAVQGFNDERDYVQRDGFKNGWNACVKEFTGAAYGIAFDALQERDR